MLSQAEMGVVKKSLKNVYEHAITSSTVDVYATENFHDHNLYL